MFFDMSVSSLSSTSSAVFGATQAGQTDWLNDAMASIKASESQGGLLGMLSNAAASNGLDATTTFLQNSQSAANAFASITSTTTTSYSSLIAQQVQARQAQDQQKQMADAMAALQQTQSMVQPTNTLDPYIYLSDGSSIDTTNNIMTMSNGDQFDITTGAKYVDPSNIIQMANGSYLDTKNNILTMADGTQLDSVTGLKISKSA
jgi:hypothetical protein